MEINYVIARKHSSDKRFCDFVSSLAHDFAGEKDVIGCLDLENALHYETEEEAIQILTNQPEWVQNKFVVIPFEKSITGCYLINKTVHQ